MFKTVLSYSLSIGEKALSFLYMLDMFYYLNAVYGSYKKRVCLMMLHIYQAHGVYQLITT